MSHAIETAPVEWPEDVAPCATVGVLTLPVQDPRSEPGRALAAVTESAAVDRWRALKAHRLPGEVLRASNAVYCKSRGGRR